MSTLSEGDKNTEVIRDISLQQFKELLKKLQNPNCPITHLDISKMTIDKKPLNLQQVFDLSEAIKKNVSITKANFGRLFDKNNPNLGAAPLAFEEDLNALLEIPSIAETEDLIKILNSRYSVNKLSDAFKGIETEYALDKMIKELKKENKKLKNVPENISADIDDLSSALNALENKDPKEIKANIEQTDKTINAKRNEILKLLPNNKFMELLLAGLEKNPPDKSVALAGVRKKQLENALKGIKNGKKQSEITGQIYAFMDLLGDRKEQQESLDAITSSPLANVPTPAKTKEELLQKYGDFGLDLSNAHTRDEITKQVQIQATHIIKTAQEKQHMLHDKFRLMRPFIEPFRTLMQQHQNFKRSSIPDTANMMNSIQGNKQRKEKEKFRQIPVIEPKISAAKIAANPNTFAATSVPVSIDPSWQVIFKFEIPVIQKISVDLQKQVNNIKKNPDRYLPQQLNDTIKNLESKISMANNTLNLLKSTSEELSWWIPAGDYSTVKKYYEDLIQSLEKTVKEIGNKRDPLSVECSKIKNSLVDVLNKFESHIENRNQDTIESPKPKR